MSSLEKIRERLALVEQECEELREKLRLREQDYVEIVRVKVLAKDITIKRKVSYRVGNIMVNAFKRPSWRTLAWPVLLYVEMWKIILEKQLRD